MVYRLTHNIGQYFQGGGCSFMTSLVASSEFVPRIGMGHAMCLHVLTLQLPEKHSLHSLHILKNCLPSR